MIETDLLYKLKENLFIHLTKYAILKIDKLNFPDYILYFANDDCLFYYDKKNDFLCVSNEKIWLVLKSTFNLNYNEVSILISYLVRKHFGINSSRTISDIDVISSW